MNLFFRVLFIIFGVLFMEFTVFKKSTTARNLRTLINKKRITKYLITFILVILLVVVNDVVVKSYGFLNNIIFQAIYYLIIGFIFSFIDWDRTKVK
ncbi:hypothetical protein [Clostridium hydrogeniformans]|uniref:hypothetical protein n=1 Tax=Clostridium hydrogeniformans TaxID=349933 RepID=UPI0004863358|nr:hypothetical protein [Clostridium hydrogeniformans]